MSAFTLLVCLAACTARTDRIQVAPEHKFAVSVKANGEQVKNFNTSLVHRIVLTPAQIQPFARKKSALPFELNVEKDGYGKVKGLRVVGGNPANMKNLGIQPRDIITAVGKKWVKTPADFLLLFTELDQYKEATLTLDRAENPHKILYYLAATAGH